MSSARGLVYLIGAGPGDPDLITLAGVRALREADVVIYDRLIATELLRHAPRHAECIDAGKAPQHHALSQERINALLIEHARAGACVVRLKGGDPFVFGRGGEELAACRSAGVACIVVPGVSSAVAGPAAIGIPLTQRGIARSFAVVTAQTGEGEPDRALNYAALAGVDTLVVLMGRASLRAWVGGLLVAGKDAATPAACVAHATTSRQQAVYTTLAKLVAAVERAELSSPMTAVVGPTAVARDLTPLRSVLPLIGRRIVLTGTTSHARRLRRALRAAGAVVMHCPFIRIRPAPLTAQVSARIAEAGTYDWIVFPSVHAVQGFFKRLLAGGRDTRALANSRIAAIGTATANALRRHGVVVDLTPETSTADGLAEALRRASLPAGDAESGRRVLCPRGDIARPTLPERLIDYGYRVDTVTVYRTVATPPPGVAIEALIDGADAVVFSSPSAVASFVERVGTDVSGVRVALGPVTAEAMNAGGMPPEVCASTPSADGVVSALERHFAAIAGTTS